MKTKGLLTALSITAALELLILLGALVLPRISNEWAAVLPSVIAQEANDERVEKGLSVLPTNPLLEKAAQAKADEMARLGYFSHVGPDGSKAWDWMKRFGYEYLYAGENLAVNFSDSKEVVEAWMNSPTHRDNILKSEYTETGIGVALGEYQGRQAIFVVELFGKPLLHQALPSHPEVHNVLGEDTPENIETVQVLGVQSNPPTLWMRLISSSHKYGMYSLALVAVILLIFLLMGIGRHHPHMVVNGALSIAVVAGIVYINSTIVFKPVTLPSDNQESSVELIDVFDTSLN